MASGFLGKAKDEFSSPRGFLHMIQTDETEAMAVNKANGELLTSNVDLDPTPPESRVWGSWYVLLNSASRIIPDKPYRSYLLFEFSVAFSPVTYNVGASLINIGLPYYAIIICACEFISLVKKRVESK
jgi:NCS1 family nucleobase:cation symporter-1